MLKIKLYGTLKRALPKEHKDGISIDADNVLEVMDALEQLIPIKDLLNKHPSNFLLGPKIKEAQSITVEQAAGAWSLRREDESQTLHIVPGITGAEINTAMIITQLVIAAITVGVTLLMSMLFPPDQPGTDTRKSALYENGLNTQREGMPLQGIYGDSVFCGFNVIEADVDVTQTGGNTGYVGGGSGGGEYTDGLQAGNWEEALSNYNQLRGAKGAPKTISNNLFSNATLRMLGEAGAGKCGGLVGDTPEAKAASIIINEVALRDAATGQYSVQGFRWTERLGFLGHGLVDITPGITNNFNVSQSLKKLSGTGSQIYITNTVSAHEVARVKARLKMTLLWTGKKGDQYNTSVTIAAEVKRLSATTWMSAGSWTFTGKSTDPVQRQVDIFAPPAVDGDEAWLFRIYRVTADSDQDRLQNDTSFGGWVEVTNKDLAYDGSDGSPASYLFGAQIDLSQFDATSPPEIGLWLRGRFVRVPSNYNAATKTYTGFWDGTWNYAYTSNPVWCWLDMATATDIGGGLPDSMFNKFALYDIAKYCDQTVKGRARFTLNKQFTDEKPLWDVLREVAQTFRAVPYWNGNQITLIQDRPVGQVDHYINNSQVQDGLFTYGGADFRERINEVQCEYDNPDDFGRKAIVVYRDQGAIDNLKRLKIANGGVLSKRVYKIGCKSRQEAYDYARTLVYDAQNQWKTCTWTTLLEACTYAPGDTIEVDDVVGLDESRGRIQSTTLNSITLHAPYKRIAGRTYELRASVNGVRIARTLPVLAVDSNSAVINVTAHGLPVDTPVGIFDANGPHKPATFRIISIKEKSKGTYEVTAQKYDPAKFDWIDGGTTAPSDEWPKIDFRLGAPEAFVGTWKASNEGPLGNKFAIELQWTPITGLLRNYVVEAWGPRDNGWSVVYDGNDTSATLSDVAQGTWLFTLKGVNIVGASGDIIRTTVQVGTTGTGETTPSLKAPLFVGLD